MADTYLARAECADCDWQQHGTARDNAAMQKAAEKHSRAEGHATVAGMFAEGERRAQR